MFGERVFLQTLGIPLGTSSAPLLVDLFLFNYEANFIQGILNFTFRYIEDVLSLNNSKLGDFVDRIFPIELEVKDTTDTDRSALYIDLHLDVDSKGRLRTNFYDKRDYFNFPIVNFTFICSNISAAAVYGVYISQLI